MNLRARLVFHAFVLTMLFSVPALATTIKGNSSHGVDNGDGSWNVTSVLGSTVSLDYNPIFDNCPSQFTCSGSGSAPVYPVPNFTNVYEQAACSAGGNSDGYPCPDFTDSKNVTFTNAVDFIFQIPVSQLQNERVTFTNFRGTLADLEVEYCDGPGSSPFPLDDGPGFLCSNYNGAPPSNLSASACLNGTTLTFVLNGPLTNLGSVTFLMLESQASSTSLAGPVLAKTFQPCPAPSIQADFVAVDLPLAKTPCFNCVNGATGGTFGMTVPIISVPKTDSTLQLLMYYGDNSYTGSCKLTFTIEQGQKVLATVSSTISGFEAGKAGYLKQQIQRPAAAGETTLNGTLKCGNTTTSAAGYVYFK